MSEYAEVHFPESLRSPSFSHDSWHAEFHSPDSPVTQSFTLRNLWVRCVSLLSRSITWSFLNHLNLWSHQVSLVTLGMLSFTLLNVWVRWVPLSWISEFAKSPSWLLACLISLSWMSEYAEFYSPESLRSPSFSHDSWHAEFHSPDSPVTQSFTLRNLWVCCVSLLSPSVHVTFPIHLNLWGRQVSLMTLGMLSFTLLNVWVRRVSLPLSWISWVRWVSLRSQFQITWSFLFIWISEVV